MQDWEKSFRGAAQGTMESRSGDGGMLEKGARAAINDGSTFPQQQQDKILTPKEGLGCSESIPKITTPSII
jgi:hypothetical protein